MTEEPEAFIVRLLEALPALREPYEVTAAECRAEGLAEAAPEIFLFEYTTRLLRQYRENLSASSQLEELAAFLDREYGTDETIDSIITSDFLAQFSDNPGTAERGHDPAAVLGSQLGRILRGERAWRADPADAAFVERLITAIPALVPLARENTYGDHDDVLVHMFLGDVVRREVENFEAGRLDEVRAVISALEAEWGGDVDESIAASFVENLPYPDEPGADLNELLGPNLRAILTTQRPPA